MQTKILKQKQKTTSNNQKQNTIKKTEQNIFNVTVLLSILLSILSVQYSILIGVGLSISSSPSFLYSNVGFGCGCGFHG